MKQAGVSTHVVAVGTSQEEIGCFGALVSGYRLNPVAGVVVDVTHETSQPGVNEKKYGVAPFGSGANLSVGAMVSPVIIRQMQAVARARALGQSALHRHRQRFAGAGTGRRAHRRGQRSQPLHALTQRDGAPLGRAGVY